MVKDIHKSGFGQSTLDKLQVYRQYLWSALPLFMSMRAVSDICIYDFFAGPGRSAAGDAGSPVIALDVINKLCASVHMAGEKRFRILWNEMDAAKCKSLEELRSSVHDPRISIMVENLPFSQSFARHRDAIGQRGSASVVFIDQYGIKEITREIFGKLAGSPYTDFLIFVSSQTAHRFHGLGSILDKLPPIDPEALRTSPARRIHLLLTDGYRRWIPDGAQCYLGGFSMRKGANVYGLVFGSGSLRGLEKFLEVTWEMCPQNGGAGNYDLFSDGINPRQPELFEIFPENVEEFKRRIEERCKGDILLQGYELYAMGLKAGICPAEVRKVVRALRAEGFDLPVAGISFDAWKKSQGDTRWE